MGAGVQMPGDMISMNLIKILKEWTQSLTILACSNERRWSLTCMKNWQPQLYDQVKALMIGYSQYASIIENEPCTKDIFTYMYWDAISDTKIDLQSQASFLFAIGVFLLL